MHVLSVLLIIKLSLTQLNKVLKNNGRLARAYEANVMKKSRKEEER